MIHISRRTLAATGMVAAVAVTPFAGMVSAHATPSVNQGSETVTPNKNLTNGQQVTVSYSNFGSDTGNVIIAECTPALVGDQANPAKYCDYDAAQPGTISGGSGSAPFNVVAGSSFAAGDTSQKCDYNHGCLIVVSDDPTTPNYAAIAAVSFKDTRVTTKTTLKAPKSGKVGSKVTIKATTKPSTKGAAPTGTVVFKDKGKKVASVKESKTGVVSAKVKLVKGKNSLTASYSGSTTYQPSTGKATTTGKVVKKKH